MVSLLRPRCIILCVIENLVNPTHLAWPPVCMVLSLCNYPRVSGFRFFFFNFFTIRAITYLLYEPKTRLRVSSICSDPCCRIYYYCFRLLSCYICSSTWDLFNDSVCIILLPCLTVFLYPPYEIGIRFVSIPIVFFTSRDPYIYKRRY